MEAKTYTLRNPVTFGSETITELTASRPLKAKDFKGFPLDPTLGDLIPLLASICQVPPSQIGELDGNDYLMAIKEFADFLPNGGATGPIV